jgi:hypothetical protein
VVEVATVQEGTSGGGHRLTSTHERLRPQPREEAAADHVGRVFDELIEHTAVWGRPPPQEHIEQATTGELAAAPAHCRRGDRCQAGCEEVQVRGSTGGYRRHQACSA